MTGKKSSVSLSFAWAICALGALFYCYEYLLRIAPSVMTTQLMSAYQINATMFGSLVACYYYIYTPMQLPVGILLDKYGPRRLLILACGICVLGTYLFANPPHFYLAAIGRCMIGFGSAFGFVAILKLATLWLPRRFFGMMIGFTMTLGMVGAMLGDVALDYVVRHHGWLATFKVMIVAGVILALTIGFFMPNSPKQKSLKPTLSYRDLVKISVCLFKMPFIWLNGFVGCFLYLSLSLFGELWGPKYLQVSHGLTSAQATAMVTAIFLGWAIGTPIIGYASTTMQRTIRIMIVAALVTALMSALIIAFPQWHGVILYVALFIFAFASSAESMIFAVACEAVDEASAATALAITNMLVMVGGIVFQPLFGKILDMHWEGVMSNGVKVYSAHAYDIALSAIPITAFISAILLMVMLKIYPRRVTAAETVDTNIAIAEAA